MTQLEQDILALLRDNSRQSNDDIAAALNSDADTIGTTIQELETRGIIKKHTTIIDDANLPDANARIYALVELSVNPEKKTGYDAIAKRIYEYPNVVGHYLLSGGVDFLVMVEGKSHQDVAAFVFDKLATLENVNSTNTHFVFKKYKEQGVVFDKRDTPKRVPIVA